MPPVGGFVHFFRLFTGRAKQALAESTKGLERFSANPDALALSRKAREAMASIIKNPYLPIEHKLNASERLAVSTIMGQAAVSTRTIKVIKTVEWSRGYWQEVMGEAKHLEQMSLKQNVFSRSATDHQRIGLANLRTVLATNTGLGPTHSAIDQLLALATHL